MTAGYKILVAGVGGQGVLRFARIVGSAAALAGEDVHVGQIYGLSQRGGSVEATVTIGAGSTAYVSAGEADLVVAFEPLEAERALPRMSPATIVVANQTRILPPNAGRGGIPYPDLASILARIGAAAGHVYPVDGAVLTARAGGRRLLNVVMAGVTAGLGVLPFAPGVVESAIEAGEANPEPQRRAFWVGTAAGRQMRSEVSGGAAAGPASAGRCRTGPVVRS